MEVKFAKSFNEKIQMLLPEEKDRNKLYFLLQTFQKISNVKQLTQDLKSLINEPKRLNIYNEIRPLIPAKHQIEYDRLAPRVDVNKMRIIRLTRRANEGLGFCVRGGLEHEVGIFVSHVDPDSTAYKRGLRAGDEIVRLNGFTINQAIHQEVLNLIKGRNELILKVRNVGMIPVRDKPTEPVTWKYVDIDQARVSKDVSPHRPRTPGQPGEEIKLYINIPVNGGLGCSICSGPPDLSGIFVQSLRRGGLAQEAGLEVGDQILKVNDTTFTNITHSEAIVAFKSSKHLDMIIRKGTGVQLFRQQAKPGECFEEDEDGEDEGLDWNPHTLVKDARNNKRKSRDSEKQAKENQRPKQSALIQQALEAIDQRTSQVSDTRDHSPNMISTVAEVHQVQRSASTKKSWMFREEERLGDRAEKDRDKPKRSSSSRGQDVVTRHPKKERRSSKAEHDQEKVPRLYRKNQDSGQPNHSALSSASQRVIVRQSTDQPSIDNPLAEETTTYQTYPDRYSTLPPPPRSSSQETRPQRYSTGFDQPPPFPEAVTDFSERPVTVESPPQSPSYDTTIPTTQAKVLNPKIYKPIEIQTFKDQEAVRPNKSPTYISDVQNNYRIQKPVLLHPTHAQNRLSAGSQDSSHSAYITDAHFNPTQLLTNEQISGRQIQQFSIKKAGCDDLGILIESNLDRVIVAEIYSGGAVHKHGGIQVGDQLMIVERHLLIGLAIEKVYGLLKQEYRSSKPTLDVVIAKAAPNELGDEVLPRPDYFDIPISNLDDFLDEDDVEIAMYNNDVPVTII